MRRYSSFTILILTAALLGPSAAADPRPPSFPLHVDGMTLVGVGVRTKTLLRVKVYAYALYIDDVAARALPPGKHTGAPFNDRILAGDFRKQIVLRALRDLSAAQIRAAFRQELRGVDRDRLRQFLDALGPARAGEECVLRWEPDGRLHLTVAGQIRAPLGDDAFSRAVFAIWLGKHQRRDMMATPDGRPLYEPLN